MARVKLALRWQTGTGREPFLLDDLAIDYEKRRVTVAGRPVRLTATEYGLLRRKLGDRAKKPKYIFTERGVGYRMPTTGA